MCCSMTIRVLVRLGAVVLAIDILEYFADLFLRKTFCESVPVKRSHSSF